MGNQLKTALLLTLMTVLIMFAGRMIGGQSGMIVALVIAAGMNFFSYWYSDRMVLKMYRAREISAAESPELYGIVRELSTRAGLPMPGVYVIPEESPNAFATGRNPQNAVVAVTEGLLRLMSRDEIAGVVAHELGHVKNRDILIGTIAATMAGAIMMLANMAQWAAIFGGGHQDDEEGGGIAGMIIMAVIAPLAATLIQMAVSRSREYLADATAASITGNGEALAGALEKLGAYSGQVPMDAEPATAHMFITNPLAGRKFATLFSTHPPIEERVARLRNVRRRSNQRREEVKKGNAPNPWDSIR